MMELKKIINDKYVLTIEDQKIFVTHEDLKEIVRIINLEMKEGFRYKREGD